MAVFREQVRETQTKYNMLWFVVDTYHGQRYFFICGCNRTVMRGWPDGVPESRGDPEASGLFYPHYPFVFKVLQAVQSPVPAPGARYFSPNFESRRGS
jgi:hypothetical protein